ncbi:MULTISPECIES: hypothetical protein [Roseobacter]|uniref:hypothetical protein n=1 Tax=Roseobacter TaxID=2433 RepID=UPI001BC2E344|nr:MULTISPECIES: hypothetical protein [Roseobacter]GIT87667.1 hypothetical protein ROBYS_26830 [Roseobacter sp. OBYS 0001]
MQAWKWVLVAAVVLGGCAEVIEEKYGSIVVDGQTYELRSRVMDGRNGTYTHTSVIVRNVPQTCLPESPGDCRAAVKNALNNNGRR